MNLALLGSTGSVGRQALEVLDKPPLVLTASKNAALLEEQARRLQPRLVCLEDESAGRNLKTALADTPVTVRYGAESAAEAASFSGADTVLNAISGVTGLLPTLAALNAGKRLLLANKESLVCGAPLIRKAREIIPVDSEHSAVFQCLQGAEPDSVKRVILTASGGAFRGFSREQLEQVTPEAALRHPTWRMGKKVTIDSATLLNKGFELIEAMVLFALPYEKVSIVLHPESIIHSLVEYTDGAMLAQLAVPDMRLPIRYALTYPARKPAPVRPLDLTAQGSLTFAEPDRETFRCLALAERAAQAGGNMGAALCGAGEAAVEAFLAGRVGFLEIEERIERSLDNTPLIENPSLDDILDTVEMCKRAC
ncbi:MAG: 1-deoxy-D-xylulose-5-phosphate reductoisomerase [Oscillospiraceae bacterium]|jgi:1-deoxy-D-xylulose-5-phosphate reductoisomerase|nr:1-deoxy-D-xylulose-5-phosphate reductoisomerase [Oscillospiraceae bacterium]